MKSQTENHHWVVARQKLLRRVKLQVTSHSGENSTALRQIKERYEKEFEGSWKISNPDRLLSAVENAELVLGGDFHAFNQSQRTHLRILRSLPRSRPVVLALECVCAEDQKGVEQFLRGKLTEAQFLQKISWSQKWGFPWVNYRPLFELARKRGYKILALNKLARVKTTRSTEEREKFAAKLLAQARKKHPDHLFYVVYGDFHLASPQLPRKLSNKFRTVIIHQDSSKLYFKLARKKLENEVRVLEKGSQHYCVLTSPPWVKWQSYYFYLEGQGDSPLDTQLIDWTEPVRGLLKLVIEDLELPMKADDFSVYLFDDHSTPGLLKKRLFKKHLSVAKSLIDQSRGFFVPDGGLFFLSTPTVNHAAQLFADYLQSRLTGRRRLLWDMPDDLTSLIWTESLGFFVSKLINHRRKPEPIQSLLTEHSPEAKEALFLILEQNVDFLRWVEGAPRRPKRFRPRRKASYYTAARLLGGLLGERMYALFRSGKINSKHVLDWLAKDVTDDDFEKFFEGIVKKLNFVPKWAKDQDTRL